MKNRDHPLVISQVRSGLGNQLFHYALGRQMATLQGVKLKLDLRRFANGAERRYGLGHFEIEADEATEEELSWFGSRNREPLAGFRIVREEHFHFDSSVLEARGNILLIGHWQSERYFAGVSSFIRKELRLIRRLDKENGRLARRILSCHGVAVHVRRGDYQRDAYVRCVHGLVPLSYYRAAMARIRQIRLRPQFFIFSDDHEWVTRNFPMGEDCTMITNNNESRPERDLMLMSLCQDHIVANSTFSWWGAWLGSSRHGIAFAPKRWFRKKGVNTKDLIPKAWRLL